MGAKGPPGWSSCKWGVLWGWRGEGLRDPHPDSHLCALSPAGVRMSGVLLLLQGPLSLVSLPGGPVGRDLGVTPPTHSQATHWVTVTSLHGWGWWQWVLSVDTPWGQGPARLGTR